MGGVRVYNAQVYGTAFSFCRCSVSAGCTVKWWRRINSKTAREKRALYFNAVFTIASHLQISRNAKKTIVTVLRPVFFLIRTSRVVSDNQKWYRDIEYSIAKLSQTNPSS